MKTDKQIMILRQEKGKEFLEMSEILDVISVNHNQPNIWFTEVDRNCRISCVPVVQKGVFIVHFPNEIEELLIFEAEFQESNILYKMNIVHKERGVPYWMGNYSIELPFESDLKLEDIHIFDYEDPTTVIYEKQKKSESMIDRHIQTVISDVVEPITVFIKAVAWINYLMAYPEIKEIRDEHDSVSVEKTIRIQNNTANKKDIVKKKDTTPTPAPAPEAATEDTNTYRVVNLNNINIKVRNKKVISQIKSRQIHRVAECWGVRGHFRHYKNGKVIYIKPYEKGKESAQKRIKKKYEI